MPAHVADTVLAPTMEHPFITRYFAQVSCDACEGWQTTMTAETALGHLANCEDLEDIAMTHNARHHPGDEGPIIVRAVVADECRETNVPPVLLGAEHAPAIS